MTMTTEDRLSALRRAACIDCRAGTPFDEEFNIHRPPDGSRPQTCEARLIEETFNFIELTPAEAAEHLAKTFTRPSEATKALRGWFPQLGLREANERIIAARRNLSASA